MVNKSHKQKKKEPPSSTAWWPPREEDISSSSSDSAEGARVWDETLESSISTLRRYVSERVEEIGLLEVDLGNYDPLLLLIDNALLDSSSDLDEEEPGGPATSIRNLIRKITSAGAAAVLGTDDSPYFLEVPSDPAQLRTRIFFRNLYNAARIEFEDRYKFPKVSTARPSDYTLLKTIGKGSFGKVFLVKHRKTAEPFALKALEKAHVVKEKQIAHTLSEKRILAAVRFPFLVHLIQHFKDNANLYMVLPFCVGGDLFGHLVKTKRHFKEDQARFFVAQIILAFEYLHFNNVIYRDLKPENVMVEANGYLKLSDFGFAKIVKGRTWTLCGTPEYLAPELIYNKGYGKSVDWWTVGVLAYELNSGASPFYSATVGKMYEKILAGRYRMPKHFPRELRDFVSRLLTTSPLTRLGSSHQGVNEIRFHPWFKGLDWVKLYRQEVKAPYKPKLSGILDTRNFDKYKETPLRKAKKNLYEAEFRKF